MRTKQFLMFMFVLFALSLVVGAQEAGPPSPQAVDPAATGSIPALAIMQFLTSIKVAGFVTWAIQFMKDSKHSMFEWINNHATWTVRLVSFAGAALSAAGIAWTYTPAEGTLLVTGLGLATIPNALWEVAQSYLIQKGWFKAVFSPQTTPAYDPATTNRNRIQPPISDELLNVG